MRDGEILENVNFKGDYYRIKFYVPAIAAAAEAGQFVHVKSGDARDYILRRPFSIHDTDKNSGELTVVYKVVGKGTEKLSRMRPGECCDLLGPQGRGYSRPEADEVPVLAAGGYGAAATYLLAKNFPGRGVFLMGARNADEIILDERYREAGFDVRLATNDGSLGKKGFVSALYDDVLRDYAGKKIKFYVCGPTPMLMATAKYLLEKNIPGEVSLDHLMCCGVGACFACVVKVKAKPGEGAEGADWRYARTCSEGPVFDASDVYLE